MMPNLVVGGCSFSDRYCINDPLGKFEFVDASYGQILADKINYNYVHYARSCGSNDRIWRLIGNDVMNGKITSEDLVLIQYTEVTRREFVFLENPKTKDKRIEEPYSIENDTYIVSFKFNSHDFYDNKILNQTFKNYEDYFVDSQFDYERFELKNLMFQTLLSYHNINAYFLILNVYGPEIEKIIKTDLFKDKIYIDRQIGFEPQHRYNGDDEFHLSNAGHYKLANDLFNYLKEKNEIR